MKGVIRWLVSALLLSCLPITLLAAEADVQTVVASLEQGYNGLSDVQAEFSQRTYVASLKREEKGSGELFIKKGAGTTAMFRFNYVKPHQQIISDGKKVWYYLPDNRQVMVSDAKTLFEGGNSVALSYLTGMGRISKDFTVKFAGSGRDKKGNYLLQLTPKKPSPVMTRLDLTVALGAVEQFQKNSTSRNLFPIVSSTVHDPFGNRTAFDFSNIRTNHGVGSDRFTFKIPTGVEVVQTR